MIVYHCDWCGDRVKNLSSSEIRWLDREKYVLCPKHYEEYWKIMHKLQKRFDSTIDPTE